MDVPTFCSLAEALTGTPVKEPTEQDKLFLQDILSNDNRGIDCSQLNELLLLVNKDRIESPFFSCFFDTNCTVSLLEECIKRFQKMAMLRYGNFIFAYRKLSRIKTDEEFRQELGDYCKAPEDTLEKYKIRSPKLLDVEPISRENTPLVGYLSAGEIIAELARAELLEECIVKVSRQQNSTFETLTEEIKTTANPSEHRSILKILQNYRSKCPNANLDDFAKYLTSILPNIRKKYSELEKIRLTATNNQDVYLTWDHMDVYFATSMRKRWEYEDLFDFVKELMNHNELKDLAIRYFDPTQSYTKNRVNKGLVESLMLKRAKCTVYSVQDSDTLGKDSELASTLTQGKPVIAYVPTVEPKKRSEQLLQEDPVTIQERLRFVLYADENFTANLNPGDLEFIQSFRDLEQFEQTRIWRSIPDAEAIADLRSQHENELMKLCQIISASEVRIYDKRAQTLKETHPLAIQVNLETGVANGVLVVRNIPDCAKLLRRILTNSLEFILENNEKDQMWYLKESITECIYRVVTKDRKLTNCFWNFYNR